MANAFNTQQNGISASFFSFKVAQYLATSQMVLLTEKMKKIVGKKKELCTNINVNSDGKFKTINGKA